MAHLPATKTYSIRLYKSKHEDLMKALDSASHTEVLLNALIQYVRESGLRGCSNQSTVESSLKSTTCDRDDGQTPRVTESNRQFNGNEVSQEAKEVYESIYDILGGI